MISLFLYAASPSFLLGSSLHIMTVSNAGKRLERDTDSNSSDIQSFQIDKEHNSNNIEEKNNKHEDTIKNNDSPSGSCKEIPFYVNSIRHEEQITSNQAVYSLRSFMKVDTTNSEINEKDSQSESSCSEIIEYDEIVKKIGKLKFMSKDKILKRNKNKNVKANDFMKLKIEDIKMKANNKRLIHKHRTSIGYFKKKVIESGALSAKNEAKKTNMWKKCGIEFSEMFRKGFNEIEYYVAKENNGFIIFRRPHEIFTFSFYTCYRFLTVKIDGNIALKHFYWFGYDVYIMDSTNIGGNVILYDFTYIGKGCKIGSNTIINKRCFLEENVIIPDNSYIGSKNFFGKGCVLNHKSDIKQVKDLKVAFDVKKFTKFHEKFYKNGISTYIGKSNYFGSECKIPSGSFIGHHNLIGSKFEAGENIKILV